MALVGLSVPPLKKFYCDYYTIPRRKSKAYLQQKNRFVKSVKNQKMRPVNFVSQVKRKPPAIAGSLMTDWDQRLRLLAGTLIIVFFEERNQLQNEIQNDLDIIQAFIHDVTSLSSCCDHLCDSQESKLSRCLLYAGRFILSIKNSKNVKKSGWKRKAIRSGRYSCAAE